MNRLLYGLAALPLLAGVAVAGQAMTLSELQMDQVTAGASITQDLITGAVTFSPTSPPSCTHPCITFEFPGTINGHSGFLTITIR